MSLLDLLDSTDGESIMDQCLMNCVRILYYKLKHYDAILSIMAHKLSNMILTGT